MKEIEKEKRETKKKKKGSKGEKDAHSFSDDENLLIIDNSEKRGRISF